ncbi:DUF5684 domain-containing protein, partial [Leucobacter chromiiresistens]|uniref:DUF5684 domain-containing protein n=1 Tax=Leucobacter chromiiresistens TaxID=1079994 RepID=UPI000AD33C2C
MDYETSTQLGAGFFLVFGVWSLVGLAVYVWYLWSLSRLFPYLGLPSGWGWIPLWNQWQLIQRGGLPGWLAIFFLVPGLSIVALVVSIIAIHRINTEFGKGGGFTVLGAFIPPLWATLFASQLRDREYGAPGYGSGDYPQAPGAASPGANGFPAAPGSSGGFAPQPGAHDQHDPAWQGLPPVPQQAAAHDPWAVPQQAAQQVSQPAVQPAAQPAPPQAAQGQYAPGAAPAAQPAAPADPWQQQASAPAPAPAPAPNNWGFSNTTEGDFERLAAEGAPPRQPAPLGAVAPPRPFSWPAVEDSNVEHESGPLLLPEPSAAALSQGQGAGTADAAAAGPAAPAIPAAEPVPAPAPAPAGPPPAGRAPHRLAPRTARPRHPAAPPAPPPDPPRRLWARYHPPPRPSTSPYTMP